MVEERYPHPSGLFFVETLIWDGTTLNPLRHNAYPAVSFLSTQERYEIAGDSTSRI